MNVTIINANDKFVKIIEELATLFPSSKISYSSNSENLESFKEAEEILKNPDKFRGYRSVDEMFESILND